MKPVATTPISHHLPKFLSLPAQGSSLGLHLDQICSAQAYSYTRGVARVPQPGHHRAALAQPPVPTCFLKLGLFDKERVNHRTTDTVKTMEICSFHLPPSRGSLFCPKLGNSGPDVCDEICQGIGEPWGCDYRLMAGKEQNPAGFEAGLSPDPSGSPCETEQA